MTRARFRTATTPEAHLTTRSSHGWSRPLTRTPATGIASGTSSTRARRPRTWRSRPRSRPSSARESSRARSTSSWSGRPPETWPSRPRPTSSSTSWVARTRAPWMSTPPAPAPSTASRSARSMSRRGSTSRAVHRRGLPVAHHGLHRPRTCILPRRRGGGGRAPRLGRGAGILDTDLYSDGRYGDLMIQPAGGSRNRRRPRRWTSGCISPG